MKEPQDNPCTCPNTLPSLPDYKLNNLPEYENHKKQLFGFQKGYPKIPKSGKQSLAISSTEYEALCKFHLKDLMYGSHVKPKQILHLPRFVVEADRAMRFMAYFMEGDDSKPATQCHMRFVFITYFPFDGTMSIYEPEDENSGLLQGKLLRRMKVPRHGKAGYYDWSDLNIGVDLKIFGRNYHIYDADKATRDYMELEGTIVNPPEIPPGRAGPSDSSGCPGKKEKTRADSDAAKFYKYDRVVLRFFCLWDDRANLYGELRPHIIYYFLSDDTIQIQEVQMENSGRDSCSVLLKRQRVTKYCPVPDVTGKETNEEEFFHPEDFVIGSTVNIYNRKFFIYDCDKFTRNFMRDRLGIDMPEAISTNPDDSCPLNLGTEEERKHDRIRRFVSYLEDQHKVLRYQMVMETVMPQTYPRTVNLMYYLSDQTATIKEPEAKKTMGIGKTFHKRTVIKKLKPDSPALDPLYDGVYTPHDFAPGSLVQVGNSRFYITDADFRVLKFYKKHVSIYGEEMFEKWKQHFMKKGYPENELYKQLEEESVYGLSGVDEKTPDCTSEYGRTYKLPIRENY